MVLLLALFVQGCQPAAPAVKTVPATPNTKVVAKKIPVAMASDLRFVAVELKREFERQTPGIQIEPTFGASGNFFAQLSNRAPFDVFLSADMQYPQQLVEQGLASKKTLFRYAIGHIVLWVRKDSLLPIAEQGAEALKNPRLKKLAIANPKLAPYGRSAEAALKKLGVYDDLKGRLVLGENVTQAAQFAETGAADAAIIGLSLATAPAFQNKGTFWQFPTDAYPRMDQGGVILDNAREPEAAQKWCDFLQTESARTIFIKYGFGLPEASPLQEHQ